MARKKCKWFLASGLEFLKLSKGSLKRDLEGLLPDLPLSLSTLSFSLTA